MNLRKQTKALDHLAVKRLDASRYHAVKIGAPLNCFITIAPRRCEGAPLERPALYFAGVRNWIGVWIRRRSLQFSAIWTVENNLAATDPHIHILMHLPSRLFSDFREALAKQYPGNGVTHLRPDDGQTAWHSSGYRGSTLNYMRKQMSPQAWWALGKRVRRVHGGPFTGRRWGTTANLNARAQENSTIRPDFRAVTEQKQRGH